MNNVDQKRKYFSLCPSVDEFNYIHMMYEHYRLKLINEGFKPPSLSRYLINIIISSDEDILHG
jgi:hypothetical protein